MAAPSLPEHPQVNFPVHVKLLIPHLISLYSKTLIGATHRATSVKTVETRESKVYLPKGHTFEGRLTGALVSQDGGVVYFRVEDLKGREWHLDTTVAEYTPVRAPENGGAE